METLIPPDVRSRLKDLHLHARRAIGQRGIGNHRSHNRGVGLEFSQYRAYEPGDELRQIDWKLYARSDRFFVRESERESPLTVWLLIDTSASMAQADQTKPHWQRLHAAQSLAACIAELAIQQGDRFGMLGLNNQQLQPLPPSHGPRGRNRLWLALNKLTARGTFPQGEQLKPVWERIAANDLVVLLSDGFDEAAIALAERLAKAGREVVMIQLITTEERDFPFSGGYLFRDPETGEQLPGDAKTLRADYLQRFNTAQSALTARLAAAGIPHVRYTLGEPLDAPLRALFAQQVRA